MIFFSFSFTWFISLFSYDPINGIIYIISRQLNAIAGHQAQTCSNTPRKVCFSPPRPFSVLSIFHLATYTLIFLGQYISGLLAKTLKTNEIYSRNVKRRSRSHVFHKITISKKNCLLRLYIYLLSRNLSRAS